jgi:phytoene synthase
MDAPDTDTLDAAVRRSDPDRWLASRFIGDAEARADVVAVYAFNDELSRIADAVREPLLGEIRLAWWGEALDEVFAGGEVRRHPVVEALAQAVRRRRLVRAPFDAMVEARHADLDKLPLADEAALKRYVDGTAGAVMALAIAILSGADGLAARPAAQAWALAGLWRLDAARGSRRLPAGFDAAAVRAKVDEAMRAARPAAAVLPVTAFPAVAYATLARRYAAGAAPSELEKRLRLTTAALTGRL